MTNFEWITQDERMVAIWLAEIGCDTCPAYTYCDKISETVDKSCFATLCSWLKCDAKKEEMLQSAQPERMTNRQWIDFLSAQFDISRTSAKEMLHGMMQWKKEDNFKKLSNGGQERSNT